METVLKLVAQQRLLRKVAARPCLAPCTVLSTGHFGFTSPLGYYRVLSSVNDVLRRGGEWVAVGKKRTTTLFLSTKRKLKLPQELWPLQYSTAPGTATLNISCT